MPTHDDNAWTELAAEARDAAEANGSRWGRYGLPIEAIDFPSEAEASQPSPKLSADEIPAAALKTITSMDKMIRSAGTLRTPCSAWIGLELPPEAGGFPLSLEVGRYICLTGFVSATLLPRPAVYAAGPHGALLHVRLTAALPMIGEICRPGEMELLPPRATCYRVDEVHESVVVTDERDRAWTRTVVQATQVQATQVQANQVQVAEQRQAVARPGTFTAPAARRWRELGPQAQTQILNTVWCVTCEATTTITEPSGRIVRGDLVLDGSCLRCGAAVARVVEGSAS